MEGFHLAHRQGSLREGKTFHYKVPFPLNLISLKKSYSGSYLEQQCSMLFMFSCQHFKLCKRNKLILHFLEKIKTDAVAQKCSLIKKCVLRNFAKFTGKHLCQSIFLSKVAGLRSATSLKKRLWDRCFHVNFCEISKYTFSYRTGHLRWLLL